MSNKNIVEATRQVEICNACRYCEGYCSVFPAITHQREFASGDIEHLANLCHNCQNCFSACQYTVPHEFAINLPKAFAEVRTDTWQDHAVPKVLGSLFHRSGVALSVLGIVLFSTLFALAKLLGSGEVGQGFYAVMSHSLMVAIFLPAFIIPLILMGVSIRKYWKSIGGTKVKLNQLNAAFISAASMRNLSGGHGEGCQFESNDGYSNSRRWMHQLTVIGFLLCFASTSSGTVLHYVFDMQAPYGLFSIPKLLGIPGGILLCIGSGALIHQKLKTRRELAADNTYGGDMAFVLLLFLVSLTGLLLFAVTGTAWVALTLAIHLGCVLTFFITLPFTKMVHGFYRMASLIRDEQLK